MPGLEMPESKSEQLSPALERLAQSMAEGHTTQGTLTETVASTIKWLNKNDEDWTGIEEFAKTLSADQQSNIKNFQGQGFTKDQLQQALVQSNTIRGRKFQPTATVN